MEDCIKILDLPDEFTLKDLKKAYRKQVMKYHPDKATNEEERVSFEAMMKLINHANEVLKEYLKNHGGKYYKPKESNSYNNYSYNTNAEKNTSEDNKREDKTTEETYRKKEKTDKEREEHIKERARYYRRMAEEMAEEDAKARAEKEAKEQAQETEHKREKTSSYQEQSYKDDPYTEYESYDEEEYYEDYGEDEEELLQMEESEAYIFLLILPILELVRIILNPIKAILLIVGLYIVSYFIYTTAEENEILNMIYHILIVPVIGIFFTWYQNKIIDESGSVTSYLIALKEKIKNERIPSYFRNLKEKFLKDFKSRVERIEQEESLKRLDKMFKDHEAEREKIEKERMRKFEEEWERKHQEEKENPEQQGMKRFDEEWVKRKMKR